MARLESYKWAVKHNYDVLTGLLYGMYSYYVHWSADAGSEAWARSLKAYTEIVYVEVKK